MLKRVVLVLALLLATAACAGSTPPPTPTPASDTPGCPEVWTGHSVVPAAFLSCSTNEDCTTAEAGGCCGGNVAVNKAHRACMQAQIMPCDVVCEPKPDMVVQCLKSACTLVPAK